MLNVYEKKSVLLDFLFHSCSKLIGQYIIHNYMHLCAVALTTSLNLPLPNSNKP